MKLNPEQLEWIVREVIRRLQAADGQAATAATPRLSLSERLVTTETLRGKLEGVSQVNTIAGAIVTPAVVDLLKEKQITLVRTNTKNGATR